MFTRGRPYPVISRGIPILSAVVVGLFIFTVATGAYSQTSRGGRLEIELRVWRVDFLPGEGAFVEWAPFENASQTPERVSGQLAAGADDSGAAPAGVERTAEGLFRKNFDMRKPGEYDLPADVVQERGRTFADLLKQGLGLPEKALEDSGRRIAVQPQREKVVVVDSEMNLLKAQILYSNLLPVEQVTRQEVYSQPSFDRGVVIDALKSTHRSADDLEDVLNRSMGRKRSSEDSHSDYDSGNRSRDRMRTQAIGDSGSGSLLFRGPRGGAGEAGVSRPPRRQSEEQPGRQLSVTVDRDSVPMQLRRRRFADMDFHALEKALEASGEVKRVNRETLRVFPGDTFLIDGGRWIPFLHFKPGLSGGDEPSLIAAKMGVSLYLTPVQLSAGGWDLRILSEMTDFSSYPQLEKIYLNFTSRANIGDTLVFKRWVAGEVAPDSSPMSERKAETLVMLTLRSN